MFTLIFDHIRQAAIIAACLVLVGCGGRFGVLAMVPLHRPRPK